MRKATILLCRLAWLNDSYSRFGRRTFALWRVPSSYVSLMVPSVTSMVHAFPWVSSWHLPPSPVHVLVLSTPLHPSQSFVSSSDLVDRPSLCVSSGPLVCLSRKLSVLPTLSWVDGVTSEAVSLRSLWDRYVIILSRATHFRTLNIIFHFTLLTRYFLFYCVYLYL